MPLKQKSHKNESALLYQRTNRVYNSANALCRKRFSVLDGPPYANGEIHVGHIINKLLKQIITLSQEQLGKRSVLRTNWDCHGLPIELEVLKRKPQTKSTNFLCRLYALNWIKTQIAQLKLIGLRCYKPKTSMSARAQLRILDKLYSLVTLKKLALGKKSVIWSLSENSSVSENDAEQCVADVVMADVLNTITSRRQTRLVNCVTVLKLMLARLNKGYKLLGKAVLSTQSRVWSLPWTACVSLPNNNGFRVNNAKTVAACETKLTNLTETKLIPINLIKSLNTVNVFNSERVPLESWQSASVQTVDLTTKLKLSLKLVYTPVSSLKYTLKNLRRSAFSISVNTAKAEICVINKLITRSLLVNVYTKPFVTLKSIRSGGQATNWVSTQLYIKLDQNEKASIVNALSSVSFYPAAHKALLTNLVQTRPDWTVSRQRRWGVPLCVVINTHNKALLNEKLQQRIKQLFNYHRETQWRKLKTLRRRARRRWWQIVDVADVWFDASSVYSLRANTSTWDLAIEGIDQHRGWFQGIFINSVLTTNKPPVKGIITHGFAMQSASKKLSKSAHTQCARGLLTQLTKLNTNTIRVWVCVVNPFENQIINKNWLLKSKAVYAKLDNTLKWALNVTLSAPQNKRFSLDLERAPPARFVLHMLRLCNNRVITNYRAYDLNKVIKTVLNMCDLLSVYLDFIKDQAYCDFKNAANRLNAIAVVRCVTSQIAVWLAPITPNISYNIRSQLRLSNGVINTLPNDWFSKRTMKNWNAIGKLRRLVSKLQFSKARALSEACVNIYAFNKRALKAFKNTNMALILGCSKVNIVWTKRVKVTVCVRLSREIAISVWESKLKRCLRCRKRLYFSEY